MICAFEGFVPTRYFDAGNIATIAYGHAIRLPQEVALLTSRLTMEEGRALLARDSEAASIAVRHTIRVPQTQRQFNALVCLAFNVGSGAFAQSTLARLINVGDPNISDAWLAWCKIKGVKNDGLLMRRKRELAYYSKPDNVSVLTDAERAHVMGIVAGTLDDMARGISED